MDCDVAVIGAGPAGIQAAIHSSRKKAATIVIGKASGSAVTGTRIGNYFGTGEVPGEDMLAHGRAQAESTGANVSMAMENYRKTIAHFQELMEER